MSNPMHQELLRQAVEAARAGDRATARARVDEVLAEDPKNIRALLILARVSEDNAEKRQAVETVLEMDAYNEQAQKLLDKLDATEREKLTIEDEVVPGITRRQLLVFGGGTVMVVLVILAAVAAVALSANGRRSSARATETGVAVALTQAILEGTRIAEEAIINVTNAQATALALNSPTPITVTPRFTLPPTPTPSPTVTLTATVGAVAGLPGRILGWSGSDIENLDVLPMYFWSLADGSRESVTENEGRYPYLYRDGQRVIYTRYYTVPSTFYNIETNNLEGDSPQNITGPWVTAEGFNRPDEASVSPDQSLMVFTAASVFTQLREVYLVNLSAVTDTESTPDPSAQPSLENVLTRITNETGDYSFPSISPDGTRVVAIRNAREGAVIGVDVVVIDIASRNITPLTTDGNTTFENFPRWSADGRSVIYAAAGQQTRANHDIFVVASDGGGAPFALIGTPSDEIYPLYSPDGVYIAYASNRGGRYDIYIYDTNAQTTSQLTFNTGEDSYPSVWLP
ncbi:MAG: hypothetical protein SF029_24285 [bacterium]|nr:hypothetical protein [bacterium]